MRHQHQNFLQCTASLSCVIPKGYLYCLSDLQYFNWTYIGMHLGFCLLFMLLSCSLVSTVIILTSFLLPPELFLGLVACTTNLLLLVAIFFFFIETQWENWEWMGQRWQSKSKRHLQHSLTTWETTPLDMGIRDLNAAFHMVMWAWYLLHQSPWKSFRKIESREGSYLLCDRNILLEYFKCWGGVPIMLKHQTFL